jgi:ATP-binding cassette, subfamily C (CFTR/MRP), member 1
MHLLSKDSIADQCIAVDAHVGKSLFNDAIIGHLRGQGKTVLLVTHALHFVADVDYIYTLKDGRMDEQGTYAELMERGGEFAKLLNEHVGAKDKDKGIEDDDAADEDARDKRDEKPKESGVTGVYAREGGEKENEGMMRKEKRTTGSLDWSGELKQRSSRRQVLTCLAVYINYVRSGKGWITAPLIILFGVLMQGSQVRSRCSQCTTCLFIRV